MSADTIDPEKPESFDKVTKTSSEDKPWLFKPGQAGGPGRPKGARNQFSEDFLADFHTTWTEGGIDAIRTVMREKPEAYLGAAVKILPKVVVKEESLESADKQRLERILGLIDIELAVRAGSGRAETGSVPGRTPPH